MADDYTPTMAAIMEDWSSVRGQAFDPEAKKRHDDREAMFLRAIAAHDAEKRAEWETEQGEPEWEYRCTGPDGDTPRRFATESEVAWHMKSGCGEVQRRKAGPWLPVPDTTNHESEGKA